MGVTGLWRLIEPSGKPVPLETLENKVLAVDVSIWLHQAIKGFQDSKGAPLANAHLLGIYHRVCKLLYFRIKPVFIFDGGVPALKKQTIAKRNQIKSKNLSEADRIQKQLLNTLLKHTAVSKVLSERTKANIASGAKLTNLNSNKNADDLYKLPATDFDSTISSSEDEETTATESTDSSPHKQWDVHTIDENSPHFKALPADIRYEILQDLKETRKQSSWGRLHELPKHSGEFSSFQMKRLLKRYSIQATLEEVEKEMGGRSLSLDELETLLKDQGVVTSDNTVGKRIASDENTKYLLIKNVKKLMHEGKKEQDLDAIKEQDETVSTTNAGESSTNTEDMTRDELAKSDQDTSNNEKISPNKVDLELEKDIQRAIELSLQGEPSTSKEKSPTLQKKKLNFSFLENFNDEDFQTSSDSENEMSQPKKTDPNVLSSAKSYMVEYSGLTPSEIAKIIGSNTRQHTTQKIKEVQLQKAVNETHRKKLDIKEDVIDVEKFDDTTNNRKQISADTIEVMSDSESSSSDFLEVEEPKCALVPDNKSLEVIIKPTDDLQDDLFSDIFENTPPKVEKSVKIDLSKPPDPLLQKESCDKIELNKELVIQVDKEITKENKLAINKSDAKNEEQSQLLTVNETEDSKTELVASSALEKEKSNSIIKELVDTLKYKSDPTKENSASSQPDKRKPTITTEELRKIETNLLQEQSELISEKSTKERVANTITDQMYQEAQELLQLFGVPYIVAPMEAEAQCAFLDLINLTDGTITDDSDIWLFGGQTVYKNFFNQSKHVLEFRVENIQHHFKLNREQMILLALLVGSDYTTGIQGVGPVIALEILAAFPTPKIADLTFSQEQLLKGLREFRKWYVAGQAKSYGKKTLRNKLKNVIFSENFPSFQVVQAYLNPTIETSEETFSWSKPDIVGLIDFARAKFGWTQIKSEEILKPVIKRLEESHMQKTIKDYFKTKHKVHSGEAESKMSKRVKKAVDKMGKEGDSSSDEDKTKTTKKSSKRINKKTVAEDAKDDVSSNQKNKESKSSKKQPRKSKVQNDTATAKLDGKLPQQKTKTQSRKRKVQENELSSDEDIKILKLAESNSQQKVQQIENDIKREIEQAKKPIKPNLHKKDVIPQRESDKVQALRSKLKAIEVFRKSKKGPGYVKKRGKTLNMPKEDAGLSESDSD